MRNSKAGTTGGAMTAYNTSGQSVARVCIVCHAVTDHSLSPLVMQPEGSEYLDYKIATCVRCGLHSSYPMPDCHALTAYYCAYYSSGQSESEPQARERLAKRVWHHLHDQAMIRIVSHYKPHGMLLEVGAGTGRFALAARKTGRWTIVCSELSSKIVQTLKDQGVDARCGEIDELGLAEESVDVIWASHVLEHLPDPVDFLMKAKSLLKHGGIMVLLVPSSRSLRARLGLSTWHYVSPPGHLWGFRPTTLKRVISNCGLTFLKSWEVHLICECVNVARKP